MHREGGMDIIVVYVDDLLIACSSKADVEEFKRGIEKEDKVVDKKTSKVLLIHGNWVERRIGRNINKLEITNT